MLFFLFPPFFFVLRAKNKTKRNESGDVAILWKGAYTSRYVRTDSDATTVVVLGVFTYIHIYTRFPFGIAVVDLKSRRVSPAEEGEDSGRRLFLLRVLL